MSSFTFLSVSISFVPIFLILTRQPFIELIVVRLPEDWVGFKDLNWEIFWALLICLSYLIQLIPFHTLSSGCFFFSDYIQCPHSDSFNLFLFEEFTTSYGQSSLYLTSKKHLEHFLFLIFFIIAEHVD